MHKCPTCGALADSKAHPFCSSRCADIDLGRWFRGNYAIPAFDSADDTTVEPLVAGSFADRLFIDTNDEDLPRAEVVLSGEAP